MRRLSIAVVILLGFFPVVLPASTFNIVDYGATPNDDTDLVTDLRHGVDYGFGNRWLLWDQKISVNVGATFTTNFKRSVSVDSKDPDALADYEDMISKLPDTRMSVRPTPEINMGVGYAW